MFCCSDANQLIRQAGNKGEEGRGILRSEPAGECEGKEIYFCEFFLINCRFVCLRLHAGALVFLHAIGTYASILFISALHSTDFSL